MVSLFGKNTPLKKLIILEQDKGNINLTVDISAYSDGQCPSQRDFGILAHLEK